MSAVTPSRKIDIRDRDLELLRGLFESRLMTTAQAAKLYFDGSAHAAKKRLQKLKAADFVSERRRRAYEPSILFLTEQALQLLEDRGIVHEYPKLSAGSLAKRAHVSDLTLQHELDVMDAKAAITAAVRTIPTFEIHEFCTWPVLCEFRASALPTSDRKPVKPDGFIRISEQTPDASLEHTFYLEVDRSQESQEKIVTKALCYRDHFTSGGLAVRFGHPRTEYKEFPFRVLMVFRTAERRNNAADAMLRLTKPIRQMVWTTTQNELLNDPLGAIWVRPVDYQVVTRGTRFHPDRSGAAIYRRQTERERFVEAAVIKHRMLHAREASQELAV